MPDTINIEIPREVAVSAHMTEDDLRVELAIHLFEQDKISLGKASEVAGINKWGFMQLLASRGISLHYGVEDYEHDLNTLKELKSL